MSACKPSLPSKHGSTPNTSPPSLEMCPQLALEDGGDLGVARADPWLCHPVCLGSGMSPGLPDKLFLNIWHYRGRHKSWEGAAPQGPAWFCKALWAWSFAGWFGRCWELQNPVREDGRMQLRGTFLDMESSPLFGMREGFHGGALQAPGETVSPCELWRALPMSAGSLLLPHCQVRTCPSHSHI